MIISPELWTYLQKNARLNVNHICIDSNFIQLNKLTNFCAMTVFDQRKIKNFNAAVRV